ncbi:hypothetical protein [Argonema antarcticum]|uniref:hypothetical protein n=1 Tax=Argonema antarcticum TaxID=2942763 RepID=UPI002011E824|nr:hypothetical protein [Argonema antarcticum]MCL1472519.1 hypothetical protein [Argonema antarcticum A004/B2]
MSRPQPPKANRSQRAYSSSYSDRQSQDSASQETGKLEAIAVGGILAPDQIISLDANLF